MCAICRRKDTFHQYLYLFCKILWNWITHKTASAFIMVPGQPNGVRSWSARSQSVTVSASRPAGSWDASSQLPKHHRAFMINAGDCWRLNATLLLQTLLIDQSPPCGLWTRLSHRSHLPENIIHYFLSPCFFSFNLFSFGAGITSCINSAVKMRPLPW